AEQFAGDGADHGLKLLNGWLKAPYQGDRRTLVPTVLNSRSFRANATPRAQARALSAEVRREIGGGRIVVNYLRQKGFTASGHSLVTAGDADAIAKPWLLGDKSAVRGQDADPNLPRTAHDSPFRCRPPDPCASFRRSRRRAGADACRRGTVLRRRSGRRQGQRHRDPPERSDRRRGGGGAV